MRQHGYSPPGKVPGCARQRSTAPADFFLWSTIRLPTLARCLAAAPALRQPLARARRSADIPMWSSYSPLHPFPPFHLNPLSPPHSDLSAVWLYPASSPSARLSSYTALISSFSFTIITRDHFFPSSSIHLSYCEAISPGKVNSRQHRSGQATQNQPRHL